MEIAENGMIVNQKGGNKYEKKNSIALIFQDTFMRVDKKKFEKNRRNNCVLDLLVFSG